MIAFTRYLPKHGRYEPGSDEIVIYAPSGPITIALTQVAYGKAVIAIDCDRSIHVHRGELAIKLAEANVEHRRKK